MSVNLGEILAAINLGGTSTGGEYLKCRCPFHHPAEGKTLWISTTTGTWGCWSTRCSRNTPASLSELLVLRGYDLRTAISLEATCDFRPYSPEDVPREPHRLREPHLALWEVDWHLADRVLREVDRYGDNALSWVSTPLSHWVSVPVVQGMVEHDEWAMLRWALRVRGVAPEALAMMKVGFAREHRCYSFPLRDACGKLVGWGKKVPYKKGYYVSGTPLQPGEPGYSPIHVNKGAVLWGWPEQRERIPLGDPLYVVEGYFDQLKLASAGLLSVALLGKNVTPVQREVLQSYDGPVVLWPDNDLDGLEAARKNCSLLIGLEDLRVVPYFMGKKDPGEMCKLTVRTCARGAVSGSEFLAKWADFLPAACRL